MFILKKITLTFALVCGCVSITAAQDSTTVQKTSLTITAAASSERVRVTAPSSVVQLHLEVYAVNGEKVFDQEIRGGNIFDWHLQDGQAQRLASGSYVCVVTAKSVSGKLTQKTGTVVVEEKTASVHPAEPLSTLQSQTIGPVEADSSWTIAGDEQPQTPTIIANDGTDGQMIRGRGALSFRIGNFFSGIDTEQMRLTEDGNLGIGTSQPQAKLDVAGTIRAERVLIAKPKSTSANAAQADIKLDDASATDSVQPLASGTGTQNRLAKWIDNAGTLADSAVTETAGNVGIGTTSPSTRLTVTDGVAPYVPAVTDLFQLKRSTSNGSVDGGVSMLFGNNSNAFRIKYGGTSDRLSFVDGGAFESLSILNGGRVGIGTSTPATALHLQAAANTELRVQSTGGALVSSVNLFYDANNHGALSFDANNAVLNVDNYYPGDATYGQINFRTNSGGLQTSRLFVRGTGNVGIGTTTPATPLEVNGVVRSTRIGLPVQYLQLAGGDPTSIRLTAQSAASAEKLLLIQNLSGESSPGNSNSIHFQLGTAAAPSSKMIIDKDGNVGIGPTAPFSGVRLAVDGSNETAVYGLSNGAWGVVGYSINGTGVQGQSTGTGAALYGLSDSGPALAVRSNTGVLMEGYPNTSTLSRSFHINLNGTYVAGSDFAEALPVRGDRAGYEPGDVMVVSAKAPGKVEKASRPYDPRVAGIYSTRPGMLGAEKNGSTRVDADEVPVAIVGIVPTKVSAMDGAIRVGDLLTTSSTPGYAMRCANRVKCVGATVGKALEPLAAGKGVIKVLVMLR